jgi:putative ABC transport system permease protein
VLVASAAIRMFNFSGRFGELEMSFPVLLFGLSLAVIASAICCLYPLWRVTRATPLGAMAAAGHQRTASRNRQVGRRTVVIVQVAASTALLVIGGLVLHNYSRILKMPLGFNPDHVMTMQVSLPPLRYASESSQRTFYDEVLNRVRHMPGIRGASACTVLPFGYGENIEPFAIAGQPKGAAQQLASVNNVMPSFFQTLEIPLLTGKYFDWTGGTGRGYSAIIDRNFADRYFRHRNPVGQALQMGDRRFSIIGVVANIKVTGLDASETPMLYLNAEQMPRTDMSIVVKAASSKPVPEIVQSIVSGIDPDQPVYDVAALQERIGTSLETSRFVAFLLASFSSLGIVITAVGLYALLAYGIILRRQEFGVRSAVGATANDLRLLVMGYAMRLVLTGAAAGSAIAIAASRYLSSELSGVRVVDPVTWVCVAGTLGVIGIAASALPAWRASHSDPAALLKAE